MNDELDENLDRLLTRAMRVRPMPDEIADLAQRAIVLAGRQRVGMRLLRWRRGEWWASVAAGVLLAMIGAAALGQLWNEGGLPTLGEVAMEEAEVDAQEAAAGEIALLGAGVIAGAVVLLLLERGLSEPWRHAIACPTGQIT